MIIFNLDNKNFFLIITYKLKLTKECADINDQQNKIQEQQERQLPVKSVLKCLPEINYFNNNNNELKDSIELKLYFKGYISFNDYRKSTGNCTKLYK